MTSITTNMAASVESSDTEAVGKDDDDKQDQNQSNESSPKKVLAENTEENPSFESTEVVTEMNAMSCGSEENAQTETQGQTVVSTMVNKVPQETNETSSAETSESNSKFCPSEKNAEKTQPELVTNQPQSEPNLGKDISENARPDSQNANERENLNQPEVRKNIDSNTEPSSGDGNEVTMKVLAEPELKREKENPDSISSISEPLTSVASSKDEEEDQIVKPKLKREESDLDDQVFRDDDQIADINVRGRRLTDRSLEPDSATSSVSSFADDRSEKGSEERPVREMLVRRRRTESTESNSDKPVLETLTFSASKIDEETNSEIKQATSGSGETCVCPLCDRSYPADNKEDVLAHLLLAHEFVIADVNFIANLPEYLRYWKKRLAKKPLSEFCSKIVTNTGIKDEAPKEEFYLLCDALQEDKEIRIQLQRKKLESVLAQQQREREETKFCRQCLFCKQTYCGNRAVLFDHLLRDHTFHMGQPDNLVFTDELFDLIQAKLDNQLCLFCEKSFKDKASLREHMRKKQHRKINPKNKEYDRFYIINYMEMGKNWETLQSEDNRLVKTNEKGSDEEEEWSGWNEESEPKVVCLFCDTACAVQDELQKHMKERHKFDLQEVNNKLQLNFYQKIKLINYIRRQIYHKTCYGCQVTLNDKDALLSHLDEHPDHINKVPDASVWDQPQYFFPTYEDDSLLCHLDDDDDGASGDALGVTVIAEDLSKDIKDTILKDQKLRRDLM